jgi:hypothetical protein
MNQRMNKRHPRMAREEKTIAVMVGLYCRGRHGGARKQLCADCRQFLEYARLRLGRCPFQENKTTCGQCPVHCYRPDMRERAKNVMGYAGPRMTWRHPVLALLHVLDGFRKPGDGRTV